MTQQSIQELAATPADLESEFGSRIEENQRRVFQIAYSVLGNAADAEEVAQEAFLRAYRKQVSLLDPVKFRGWVNRIVFRLALNRKRGARRQLQRDTEWHAEGPGDVVDEAKRNTDRLLLQQLRGAIDDLPEKLRSVLQLSLAEEMDAAEVAAVLGIPAGTVRSRLHTARKMLLEVMR